MRTYSKIPVNMWLGERWLKIKKIGDHAFAICAYLQSNPFSNMLGFYYLPLFQISESLGTPLDKVKSCIQALTEIGYCSYDEELSYIWIHNMAYDEIGPLKPNDKQVLGIKRQLEQMPKNKLTHQYYEFYKDVFCLEYANTTKRYDVPPDDHCVLDHHDSIVETFEIPLAKPLMKGLTMPLRSQDQDQDQKQDQDQDQKQETKDRHVEFAQNSMGDEPDDRAVPPEGGGHSGSLKNSEPASTMKIVTTEKKTKQHQQDVQVVFSFWQETLHHPLAKLDAKRKRCIERGLKDYSIEKLCQAIRGCSRSPYHMGDNKTGEIYDDLTLILRDASKIEGFMRKAGSPSSALSYGRTTTYAQHAVYDPTEGAL